MLCNTRHFILALSLWAMALSPVPLHATSLYLDPPTKNYVVGETVSVRVIVSSEEDINAVSGRLIVPADVLRPVSIARHNSIVDLWLQEPAVSSRGEIVFEGLILDDGFSGNGEVFTINLQVLHGRDAALQFAEGLALANDGLGTNILDDIRGASFTFLTTTRGTDEGALKEIPDTIPALAAGELPQGQLFAPTVIEYTQKLASLQDLRIRGVTYPEATVHVKLQQEGAEQVEEYGVTSDAGGNFSYLHNINGMRVSQTASVFSAIRDVFNPERHFFWLQAEKDGLISSPTQVFEVLVGGFDVRNFLLVSAASVILIILIVVLVLLVRLSSRTVTRRRARIARENA